MKQYIALPPGLAERPHTRSGGITRAGFETQAVMFTTSYPYAASDYDIDELVGLFLEYDKALTDADRYFEILGGYLFDRTSDDQVIATRVFGIALDRSKGFEIVEGGSVLLRDHWQHRDEPNEFLDEDRASFHPGGWSFIVRAKVPAATFPESNEELKICKRCPEITQIHHTVNQTSDTSVELSFSLDQIDGTAASYDWNWGDGTSDNDGGQTPAHTYERPVGTEVERTVTVTLNGPADCSSVFTTKVTIPAVCPRIDQITVSYGEGEGATQTVHFSVSMLPASAKADSFEWHLGEGIPVETSETGSITHIYKRPDGDAKIYAVTVKSIGPDSCQSEKSTEVTIPGVCPKLSLASQLGAVADGKQTVSFEITVTEGAQPTQFTWKWGDGSEETGSSLTATHAYDQVYGSTPATYVVSVSASGPGSCNSDASVQVGIPAIPCPIITRVSHKESVSDTEVQVVFTIEVSGDAPDTYEWTWGDGTAAVSTDQLSISHTYARGAGKSEKYIATVRSVGPAPCESSAQTEVGIPGICPRLGALQYVLNDPASGRQKANFTATVAEGTPDSYTWQWGDGSAPETTTGNQASHDFLQEIGKDVSFDVRVIATGPGSCESDASVTVVIGDIPCPQLTALAATITETREASVIVTAKATVTGGTPAKYVWNWGDGATTETTLPSTSHEYPRKATTQTPQIQLTANGPGSCESTANTRVNIPSIEKPPVVPLLCRLMNWIVAYLIAVTAGVLLVFYVDNACDATANGGLTTLSVIMVVLSIASVLLWIMYRKGLCPPKACDWYAVGWSAMFTMTATAFYSMSCCGSGGWVAGLIFFVLGAGFAYLWFTKCAVNSRVQTFLLYVAIFVVASLISVFAVANSFLACI